jgi:hypothetical protein
MAFTVETHAQAKENADFEAGIAAYQANDLPLVYKTFLEINLSATTILVEHS